MKTMASPVGCSALSFHGHGPVLVEPEGENAREQP